MLLLIVPIDVVVNCSKRLVVADVGRCLRLIGTILYVAVVVFVVTVTIDTQITKVVLVFGLNSHGGVQFLSKYSLIV